MIVRLWLTVLTTKLLTVVAFKSQMTDLPTRGSIPKSQPLVLIPHNTAYSITVNKSRTEFYVLVHQSTRRNLSVTVTPCNNRLNWDLKFIPLIHTQTIILGNNISKDLGKLLIEYTGVSRPVTYDHGRARKGLYVITAEAIDDESMVMFYVSLRQKSPKKQFGFRPNGIKIKKGSRKINLRWNLSHIDYNLITYIIVISTSKIYLTLCEAESRLEKQKWNFTTINSDEDDFPIDDRLEIHYLGNSTNYTLKDLVYNSTYYFTVFSLNGSHNMAMQYANATYKYQRPKPIGLKDAKPKIVNLRAQSGKASFRYKVGSKSLEEGGDTKTLYWYVMPCGGVVNIEIRRKKKILVKKRVFGYEKMTLNNTKYGERYVLIVETVSVDEAQRVGSIEVMATVRPMMLPMPDMPSDLSIQQYVNPNDCHSVTIGWLSAKSHTDLWYCVYVKEYNTTNNDVDFSYKPDQCKLSYGNIRRRNNNIVNYRRKTGCYIDKRQRVTVRKILKLKSSTTYTVLVTVSKLNGRTLSYDLLKLDTNSCELN